MEPKGRGMPACAGRDGGRRSAIVSHPANLVYDLFTFGGT
jgi:hypothetical protein